MSAPNRAGARQVCREHHVRGAGGSPGCFEPAVRAGYCDRHYLQAWSAWKRRNIARGLCWCGADRAPGRKKCHRHLTTHRDWRRAAAAKRKAADGSNEYWALDLVERKQLRLYELAEGKEFARIEAKAAERASADAARPRLIRAMVPQPTERQRAFVSRFLDHGYGARAAREAGYAPLSAARGGSGARVRAHRLLHHSPAVRVYLADVRRRREAEQEGAEREREALWLRRAAIDAARLGGAKGQGIAATFLRVADELRAGLRQATGLTRNRAGLL